MKLGNLEITGDLVLAPMAGVTDLAFRTICAELGAAVTVTEMVSSRALIYQDKKSRSLLHKTPLGVCGAQIFGNDPSVMADGAVLALEASGADFIDINMGCPMPKIANNGDGSALMKDPEKAARIVEAVVKAVPVPVTVKMRKGWDKSSCNAPELAAMLEQAGASAIAVHGRTKTMLYSGVADWDCIRAVKEAVKIPVFRPLIGSDKQEIIARAEEIGTFDISTEAAPDCCTLFMPRRPETHAKLDAVHEAWELFDHEEMIERLLKQTEYIDFESNTYKAPKTLKRKHSELAPREIYQDHE